MSWLLPTASYLPTSFPVLFFIMFPPACLLKKSDSLLYSSLESPGTFMENLHHIYYLSFLCYLGWFKFSTKICEIYTCISLELLDEFSVQNNLLLFISWFFSYYLFYWLFRQVLWFIPHKNVLLGHPLQLLPFAFSCE